MAAIRLGTSLLFVPIIISSNVVVFADHPQGVDSFGDPLPRGAIARLGTTRLRHGNSVSEVTFHPDGKKLATASIDGSVCFWDVKTGRRLRKQLYDGIFVSRVAFSRDGSHYLVVDGNGAVIVCETQSGRRLHTINFGRRPWPVFSPDGKSILIASEHAGLQFWKLENDGAKKVKDVPGRYQGAVYSPKGDWIAAWGEQTVYRLSSSDFTTQAKMAGHENTIRGVDISPDGTAIASASEDGKFCIWNAETGREIWKQTDAHAGTDVSCVRFSPDGRMIATAGYDRSVRFWDVKARKEIRSFNDLFQRQVRWSPDGKLVATFGGNGTGVRLRDAVTGDDTPPLRGHRYYAREMLYVNDGKWLATSTSNDSSLRIWDPRTGEQLRAFHEHLASMMAPVAGTSLIAVTGRNRFALFDYATGKHRMLGGAEMETMNRYWWPVVSPDGKRMVTVRSSTNVIQQDGRTTVERGQRLITWRMPQSIPIHEIEVEQLGRVQFLPDNKHVIGRIVKKIGDKNYQERISIWPVDDLSKPRSIFENNFEFGNSDSIYAIAVSPDGTKVALARQKADALLINVADGKVVHRWQPDEEVYVREISFCDDGTRLLTGPYTFRVWGVESGDLIQTLGPDPSISDCGRLSRDGKLLAMGNRVGDVDLWDVDHGKRLVQFKGHEFNVRDFVFSPDNKTLISSASDCTLLVWSLDPKDWSAPQINPKLTMDDLWKRLGDREAAIGYDAARQMIDQPDRSLTFLRKQLEHEVFVSDTPILEDRKSIQFHRAAYVLDSINLEAASKVRSKIRRQPVDPTSGTADPVGDADRAKGVVIVRATKLISSADASIVLMSSDNQLLLLNPCTLRRLANLPINGQPVAISSDGRFCVVTTGTETVVWEVATATMLRRLRRRFNRTRVCALHADGRRLVIARDRPGDFVTIDLLTGDEVVAEPSVRLRLSPQYPALSPDGRTYLTTDIRSNRVTMLDTKTGQPRWELAGDQRSRIRQWQFLGGGQSIAICSTWNGRFFVYDSLTGKRRSEVVIGKTAPGVFGLSSRGQYFFTAVRGEELVVYETATAEPIHEFNVGEIRNVRMLPNERHVAVTGQSGDISVLDLALIAAPRRSDERVEEYLHRLATDLTGTDSRRAFSAVWALSLAGEPAVKVLRQRLLKKSTMTDQEIGKLIRQMDADDFQQREQATQQLSSLGTPALRLLEESVEKSTSFEVRLRCQKIIQSIRSRHANLERSRAATLLRQIATPSALELQKQIDHGVTN